MTRWKGLKIQKVRVNTTGLQFDRIERQYKNVSLPKGYKEQDSAGRSHYFNRYRPSFYSPKDYKILIIRNNEKENSRLLDQEFDIFEFSPETGLTQSQETIKNINATERVCTVFWWKYENKSYLIGEELGKQRHALLYELQFIDGNYKTTRIVSQSRYLNHNKEYSVLD
jgi:hypothetical protein